MPNFGNFSQQLDMSSLLTNHKAKYKNQFEMLLSNLEKLVANISCGQPKFVLMISNFNEHFKSCSTHDMIFVEGA